MSRANILDEYIMRNKYTGEVLPMITESVYEFMPEEDKVTYDALPDVVTIYRGCFFMEAHSQRGQSWTTNPKVAEFFAWDNYCYLPEDELRQRNVIKATIKKSDIFGYTNCRKEFECIVDTDKLMGVKYFKEIDNDTLAKILKAQEKSKQGEINE